MSGPQDAVLSLPELVEQILLYLDMADILVSAQRVNKRWLNIITASTKLQQALFFKPISHPAKPPRQSDPPLDETETRSSIPEPYRTHLSESFNPLLVRHFGAEFFNVSSRRDLQRWVYFTTRMPWFTKGRGNPELNDGDANKDERERRYKAFIRSRASWRHMLVTQPPQPGLGYVRRTHDPGNHETVLKGYIDTMHPQPPLNKRPGGSEVFDGLRFGLLYDLVQYHVIHHVPGFRIWFRVMWGAVSKSPYPFDQACEASLQETGVVLALSLYRDRLPNPAPGHVAAFDRVFRSEDFWLPEDNAVEVYRMDAR